MGLKLSSAALMAALFLLSACQGGPPPASAPPPEPPPASASTLPEEAPQPLPGTPPAPDGGPLTESPGPEGPASPEEPPEDPLPEPEPEPPPNTTLYVLMYHHFVQEEGAGLNDWTLTQERFRADLEWLSSHGYATVLPRELAAGEPLPQRAVMLTFDDGYASNYTLAYPLLQEYGAKAAIALITSLNEEGHPEYLSWDMCQEMARSGLVELGSHTHALHQEHPRGVKRLPGESREEYEARVLPDLERSAALIEEHTGAEVTYFAYPHGQKDSWAADFIAQRFSVTVTTKHGPGSVAGGLYSLPRYNISTKQSPSRFLPE